jgi:SEC-C motif
MTLGLGILTRKFCCIVSDRRTSAGNALVDDEFDKTCMLRTRDARVAVTFTGLASHKQYHSKVRLIHYLKASAAPDYLLPAMMGRICTILSKDFLQDQDIRTIPKRVRKFTLMVMGYRYDRHEKSTPCFGMISNFQDMDAGQAVDEPWPEFRPFLYPFPDTINYEGMMIGQTGALDRKKMEDLARPTQEPRPQAVVGRLVNLVQDASRVSSLIGGQVTSIVIPQGWREEVQVAYHVSSPQRTIYWPASVTAHPTELWSLDGFNLTADGSIYLKVPIVSGNRSCPCGSGLKYKLCHRPRRANHVRMSGPDGLRKMPIQLDPAIKLIGGVAIVEKEGGIVEGMQKFEFDRRRSARKNRGYK